MCAVGCVWYSWGDDSSVQRALSKAESVVLAVVDGLHTPAAVLQHFQVRQRLSRSPSSSLSAQELKALPWVTDAEALGLHGQNMDYKIVNRLDMGNNDEEGERRVRTKQMTQRIVRSQHVIHLLQAALQAIESDGSTDEQFLSMNRLLESWSNTAVVTESVRWNQTLDFGTAQFSSACDNLMKEIFAWLIPCIRFARGDDSLSSEVVTLSKRFLTQLEALEQMLCLYDAEQQRVRHLMDEQLIAPITLRMLSGYVLSVGGIGSLLLTALVDKHSALQTAGNATKNAQKNKKKPVAGAQSSLEPLTADSTDPWLHMKHCVVHASRLNSTCVSSPLSVC